MKNRILILLTFLVSSFCMGQQQITWDDLAQVTFTEKFFAEYDEYFLYPEFSPSVRELDGKKVTIKGYFLNIDPDEKLHILSKGPMSACFFCGEGGPETAIELLFIDKPNFETDDIISVTGILNLNKDDVNHFNYILKDCEAEAID